MAAFKFRLDFMISLRKKREEEAAVKLARRLASIRELEKLIEALENNLAQAAQEISDLGRAGKLTGPLLLLFSSHQERVRKEIKKNLELLSLSRRQEVIERKALNKAVTDRRIMEKVKDNQKSAWRLELEHDEQNNMEELAALSKAKRLRDNRDENENSNNHRA
ncbi:MAG: flagellar FliJ family protein [Deltaproteobacteria bacterium]|jgi:flagellar export protein FliJ|nr:flagellar FliJ family protein [Deltaproteobacteria bacterium]